MNWTLYIVKNGIKNYSEIISVKNLIEFLINPLINFADNVLFGFDQTEREIIIHNHSSW